MTTLLITELRDIDWEAARRATIDRINLSFRMACEQFGYHKEFGRYQLRDRCAAGIVVREIVWPRGPDEVRPEPRKLWSDIMDELCYAKPFVFQKRGHLPIVGFAYRYELCCGYIEPYIEQSEETKEKARLTRQITALKREMDAAPLFAGDLEPQLVEITGLRQAMDGKHRSRADAKR